MSLVNEIKGDLFTVRGIGVTLLHNLVIIGAMGALIFWNVQVMGNDVAIQMPGKTVSRK